VKIEVRVEGMDGARQLLDGFSARRMAAVVATTLTRSARELEPEWRGALATELDRPQQFTVNATRVQPATAQNLHAELAIKDKPVRAGAPAPVDWLGPNESGGDRFIKRFERALIAQGSMPSGMRAVPGPFARLDGFGNVSRGQIVEVINQLGSHFSPGYQRVIGATAAKRLAAARRAGREYVAFPRRQGRIKPGVYERSGRQLLMVFAFVALVTYRKRLTLDQIAISQAPVILSRQMERAISEHRARLAQRGQA